MDPRKERILATLIDDYIASAEPVGSRTLARKYNLGISPATIRNEMADLEAWGFLEQPHTSSGRIPSDKGYRYYVDQLLKRPPIDREIAERIHAAFDVRVRELQWVIHHAARIVSDITRYPSVVVASAADEARFSKLSFVPIDDKTLLLVLSTDIGTIEHRLVDVPPGLSVKELEALAKEFSREFYGMSVSDLKQRILEPLKGDISRYRHLWKTAFQGLAEENALWMQRATLAGPLTILNYPEFRDVSKVQRILGFLEEAAAFDPLFVGMPAGGVQVVIGSESLIEAIHDCSVATATYCAGGRVVGQILVLGPRRMPYGRIMTVLD
ncbi:MAG: heat-inducible transcriptional repressor HrcA, partial [Firmicutes bacterium]|nr:heat-inducible transcriptional repressor HrcA [Bacillota bacterium]